MRVTLRCLNADLQSFILPGGLSLHQVFTSIKILSSKRCIDCSNRNIY